MISVKNNIVAFAENFKARLGAAFAMPALNYNFAA